MRKKTKRESFRQVRKIIKTKMSSGNLIKVLNTWAVAVNKILCNIYWTRLKIQEMGKRLGN